MVAYTAGMVADRDIPGIQQRSDSAAPEGPVCRPQRGLRRHQRGLHAAGAGAMGGVLAMTLVVRLNPATAPGPWRLATATAVWSAWGCVFFGMQVLLALALLSVVTRRPIPRPGAPILAELIAVMYLTAAVFSRLNADLSDRFLTGSAHRLLGQDAIAWLGVAIVLVLLGPVARRSGTPHRWMTVLLVVALLLPVVRLQFQPSPPAANAVPGRQSLGQPDRPILVIGVDGIDLNVLMANATRLRLPNLEGLRSGSSWGPMTPDPPFLYRSLWTTTATGCYPSTHGVKGQTGWQLLAQSNRPILLLPWTPIGSKAMLPWGFSRRTEPPPSRIPPLWSRLKGPSNADRSICWPGLWSTTDRPLTPPALPIGMVEPGFRASLDTALTPFPEHSEAVWTATLEDLARVAAAVENAHGRMVWVQLHAVAEVRRRLEPLRPEDVRQRVVLDLSLELLDTLIGQLIAAMPSDGLTAVVAPYGYDEPDGWERLRRLAGFTATWNASAANCPDGLLYLHGSGVRVGRRQGTVELGDLVPTLCYLLGLPLAQDMNGRVILEAIDPAYLQRTPLWITD